MRNLYLRNTEAHTRYMENPEKLAGAMIPLPENAETWPEEVLRELHKQVPYIAAYSASIEMSRMNDQLGYAFGNVTISSRSELEPTPEGAKSAGVARVRVPVIIRERKLCPFDVLVTEDARMLPLTEERLRQALFRPHMFDVTGSAPPDRSLLSQLYPPYRQNLGALSGAGMGGNVTALGKTAALANSSNPKAAAGPSVKQLLKTGGILEGIASCVDPKHIVEVAGGMLGLTEKNAQAKEAVQAILRFEVQEPVEKVASTPAFQVFQIRKPESPDGHYTVKAAEVGFGLGQSFELDRRQVVEAFGAKIAKDVDVSGSSVVSDIPETTGDSEADRASVISEAGTYKVVDTSGNELVGMVFPNLVDPLTLKRGPSTVFFNGSVTALQPDVVGIRVGDITEPPTGDPAGTGSWMYEDEHGPAMTMPAKVLGGLPGGGFLVETATGDSAQFQPPADAVFVPFGQSGAVPLVGSSEAADELAKKEGSYCEIRATSANHIELAMFHQTKEGARGVVDYDDAVYELARAGVSPEVTSEKIGKSIALGCTERVKLAFKSRPLAIKVARDHSDHPLRRVLVKEAEDLPDPQSVDTVLSLGFLSKDNESVFVSYLPQMEITQSRLCEMLVAARIGLRSIPEPPLEKSIKSLEEVISGLKTVAFRNN